MSLCKKKIKKKTKNKTSCYAYATEKLHTSKVLSLAAVCVSVMWEWLENVPAVQSRQRQSCHGLFLAGQRKASPGLLWRTAQPPLDPSGSLPLQRRASCWTEPLTAHAKGLSGCWATPKQPKIHLGQQRRLKNSHVSTWRVTEEEGKREKDISVWYSKSWCTYTWLRLQPLEWLWKCSRIDLVSAATVTTG